MKVLILGSGLLGVTTAYELAKRGFSVVVVDRNPGPAEETSFANGGQLSYTHGEPWATPGTLMKLPRWLADADAPLVLRLRADWQMMGWIMRFLRNCTGARMRANCITLLRLGLYSRERMQALMSETGMAFDASNNGIVQIYASRKEFDSAKRNNDFQAKFGGGQRVLTRDQCLTLEPSLAHSSRVIVGGLHADADQTGDAYAFCRELARVAAERYGVTFHYDTPVEAITAEGDNIVGISTAKGDMQADGYVMALGSYCPFFLRPLGVKAPIYPMKGYSLTIEADEFCPRMSVTDDAYKIVFTPLGRLVRVAGTAEFAGYNQDIRKKRIRAIVKTAGIVYPRIDWTRLTHEWACLRPQTPDGPPILGPTPYRNLFLNTGHGTLGWTQAAGSAAFVADLMEGKPPPILPQGLTLERYA